VGEKSFTAKDAKEERMGKWILDIGYWKLGNQTEEAGGPVQKEAGCASENLRQDAAATSGGEERNVDILTFLSILKP